MEHFDFGSDVTSLKQSEQGLRWYRLTLILSSFTVLVMVAVQVYMTYTASRLEARALESNAVKMQLEELKITHDRAQQKYLALRKNKQNNTIREGEHVHEYLSSFASIIPDEVRLEEVRFQLNREITITGVSRSLQEMTTFFERLKKESCFRNHVLTGINKQEDNDGCFRFSAVLELS